MTPVLALILLGARIPVDARGMALSITQIVLVPVLAGGFCSFPHLPSLSSLNQRAAGRRVREGWSVNPQLQQLKMPLDYGLSFVCCLAGLTCSTYCPILVAKAKPFLTFASLLDTCACVGASLASNSETARSSIGLAVLAPVSSAPFHHASLDIVCFSSPYVLGLQYDTADIQAVILQPVFSHTVLYSSPCTAPLLIRAIILQYTVLECNA